MFAIKLGTGLPAELLSTIIAVQLLAVKRNIIKTTNHHIKSINSILLQRKQLASNKFSNSSSDKTSV
jgi:hypothetical protein